MQKINRSVFLGLCAVLLVQPFQSSAQSSSVNAFSPYTFYGLGDLSVQGPTFLRSMGGVGVAFNHPRKANYLNPAAFAYTNPKSVLFNVGIEGGGTFIQTNEGKTSHNEFNFREVALQLPIAKGWGMGVSVTPYSSLGYKLSLFETDETILADVGNVVYNYLGDGNITQMKLGLGGTVVKGFTLGAEMIYYHGKLNRTFNTDINAVIGNAPQRNMAGTESQQYSRIWMKFGAQYSPIYTERRKLSFGATYQPKFNIRPHSVREIYANDGIYNHTIEYSNSKIDYHMPSSFTVGTFYETQTLGFGLDYSFDKWAGISNETDQDVFNGVGYRNRNTIKAGMQFTPDPIDVRYYRRRLSYRAGYRYNNHYMSFHDHKIHEHAITLGVGFPIRNGLTNVDVGVEVGQRGTKATVYSGTRQFQMAKEQYFKISVGFSLFGEDFWFMKYKYD